MKEVKNKNRRKADSLTEGLHESANTAASLEVYGVVNVSKIAQSEDLWSGGVSRMIGEVLYKNEYLSD